MPEDTTAWDISELALPDRSIIHEFTLNGFGAYGSAASVRLAIGDQLPTTVAEMSRLEPLFAGMGFQGPEPRTIPISAPAIFRLSRLKMYLPAQGRRLILEGVTIAAVVADIMVAIVVSAVPNEVPDCVLSA